MKVFRIILGILLIGGGACLFLYPNVRDWKTQANVDAIESEFQEYQEGDVSGPSGATSSTSTVSP